MNDIKVRIRMQGALGMPIPTKVSELENDAGYQNAQQVEQAITSKGYQTAAEVDSKIRAQMPRMVSQLENDMRYQTESQVRSAVEAAKQARAYFDETTYGSVTKIKQDLLEKFIAVDLTEATPKTPERLYISTERGRIEVPSKSDLPTQVSQLANDAGYQNAAQVEQDITSKGYQTAQQVEQAITSKGYQTAADVQSAIANKADKSELPTHVSQLQNDAGYQTGAQVQAALEPYATKEDVYDLLPTETASGDIVQISDGAPVPVKSLDIGASGTKLRLTGANIIGGFQDRSIYGVTYAVQEDGSVILSGTPTANHVADSVELDPFMLEMLRGRTVTLSHGAESDGMFDMHLRAETPTGVKLIYGSKTGASGVVDETATRLFLRLQTRPAALGVEVNFHIFPMVSLGAVAQPYAPYVEHTYDIGQTVSLLYGDNTLYAGGAQISLEYRADIKKYIAKVVTP